MNSDTVLRLLNAAIEKGKGKPSHTHIAVDELTVIKAHITQQDIELQKLRDDITDVNIPSER